MKSTTSFIRLGEIAEFRNGLNFAKENRGSGCVLIGVPDFQDRFTPDYASLKEINPDGIGTEADYLKKDDIIFVRSNGNKALVGRSLFIDTDIRAMFSGFCIRARLNGDIVDPQFLAYFTRTARFKKSIASSAGTNINNLNQDILSNVKVPLFEKRHQKQIVELLGSLDAKIELNRRLNAELEAMAKLLYDYWFVQFDFPISAAQAAAMVCPDLEGKPYRASGGKMVHHPELKREIPEGWEVGTLLDIATFTNGIACQKYPPVDAQRLHVIKIKEMRDGFTADSEFVTDQVPKKVKVENGDILFSWSASLEVMIWSGGSGALNQHIFKVTSSSHPRSYVYFVLLDYLQHFRMLADLRKTTMGHITREHLEQSRIAIAPKEISNAFERVVNPLIERILRSQDETHELTQLRDWLLPMLMNGQVTVADCPAESA